MNILVLEGGARKKGNTATLVGWVTEELMAMGHTVRSEYLQSKTIKGCLGCGECKKVSDRVACIQQDDALAILDRIVQSDLVILTSPLYFWGLAGPLKSLIDRTYSLYTGYHQPDHDSLVKNQRQALVMTGGGPYENNAEPVFEAFRKMQAPHMARNVGELYIGGCKAPGVLDETAREKAIAFAREAVR